VITHHVAEPLNGLQTSVVLPLEITYTRK